MKMEPGKMIFPRDLILRRFSSGCAKQWKLFWNKRNSIYEFYRNIYYRWISAIDMYVILYMVCNAFYL